MLRRHWRIATPQGLTVNWQYRENPPEGGWRWSPGERRKGCCRKSMRLWRFGGGDTRAGGADLAKNRSLALEAMALAETLGAGRFCTARRRQSIHLDPILWTKPRRGVPSTPMVRPSWRWKRRWRDGRARIRMGRQAAPCGSPTWWGGRQPVWRHGAGGDGGRLRWTGLPMAKGRGVAMFRWQHWRGRSRPCWGGAAWRSFRRS